MQPSKTAGIGPLVFHKCNGQPWDWKRLGSNQNQDLCQVDLPLNKNHGRLQCSHFTKHIWKKRDPGLFLVKESTPKILQPFKTIHQIINGDLVEQCRAGGLKRTGFQTRKSPKRPQKKTKADAFGQSIVFHQPNSRINKIAFRVFHQGNLHSNLGRYIISPK